MRQNAKSLATICILSTMLVVTISGTLALYLGQEEMLREQYPCDVKVSLDNSLDRLTMLDFGRAVADLAVKCNVKISKCGADAAFGGPEPAFEDGSGIVYQGGLLSFNAEGRQEDCLEFVRGIDVVAGETLPEGTYQVAQSIFEAREERYGIYGGLLFLCAFFGLLFLAVTVLIIYFKQVSEGYEDKEQFAILQKVGMDDRQVRSTINRQVLWVFFIPLGMTLAHMVFASRIMARMLQVFRLYDWGLVLRCIGGVCVLFALLYLAVYKLTAKVYYGIVRR
jgi:hypothetical protein